MNVKELIKRHEGVRLLPYEDSEGIWTIGVGRNLEANGITEDECERMLDHDLQNAWDECAKYPWFLALTEGRKAACLDLMFNIGAKRFSGFQHFIAAMGAKDYARAADELIDSKWHHQVGTRALEIENLIRNEVWPT